LYSVGLILGGWQVDRFGYRNVMLVNMVCMLPSVVLVTFAPNQVALLLGQMLCGIPWGVFAALAPAYSSELCPIGLRGYLTTYVNLCWYVEGEGGV
jgi:SP family general alpha glucoside:H+ symporter-like MFS transporter